MKLINYIPNYDDCIDIPLTKHTWVWIQNIITDEDDMDFCVELHHDNDFETMVDSDFLWLHGNESKKDIISKAIEQALATLPQMYYAEIERNTEYAFHIYETISDIWFSTHQYKTRDLGAFMYERKKEYEQD